jgi:hypothetical protein
MTISNTASKAVYTGDGSTTRFDVKDGSQGIYFKLSTDLVVTLRTDSTVTTQTEGLHYTVTGAGSDTGYITFLTAPTSGYEVRIERHTPLTQDLDLSAGGSFSPDNIESAFDKLTRIAQDLSRGGSGDGGSGTYDTDPLTKTADGAGWDAESLPIKSVAAPVDNTDAVNYATLQAAQLAAGGGNTQGAASSTAHQLVAFADTTGKVLEASTLTADVVKMTTGVPSAAVAGTDYQLPITTARLAALPFGDYTTVASAATVDLGAQASFYVLISGTTTITSFGTGTNILRLVSFLGSLTLTHNGSTLILPTGANIQTAANDSMLVVRGASGAWGVVAYYRADGSSLLSTYLKSNTTATLTAGFAVTPYSAGTKSTGTFTPDPANGNYQYATNGGAHTLAAPASDCAIDILYTNNGSAGSITFSGFTVGSSTGSSLTTTNTSKFLISIRRVNSVATYSVYALQ